MGEARKKGKKGGTLSRYSTKVMKLRKVIKLNQLLRDLTATDFKAGILLNKLMIPILNLEMKSIAIMAAPLIIERFQSLDLAGLKEVYIYSSA